MSVELSMSQVDVSPQPHPDGAQSDLTIDFPLIHVFEKQRQYPRVKLSCNAKVGLKSKQVIPVLLHDISPCGVQIRCDPNAAKFDQPPRQRCHQGQDHSCGANRIRPKNCRPGPQFKLRGNGEKGQIRGSSESHLLHTLPARRRRVRHAVLSHASRFAQALKLAPRYGAFDLNHLRSSRHNSSPIDSAIVARSCCGDANSPGGNFI